MEEKEFCNGRTEREVEVMLAHRFFIIVRNMSIPWILIDSNDLFFMIGSILANL